jgi:ubiquitin-activating enzyme E1 C
MTSTISCQKRSALEMTNSSSSSQQQQQQLPQDTTIRPPLSSRQRGTLKTLLTRSSPFANETGSLPIGEFNTSCGNNDTDGALSVTSNAKILVVGAGGLGCEILKDLAMSGVVKDVVVIDLDTIDVTNLNRQFLFRSKDVGQSKAEVAARFINQRCPWMSVVPYHGKIQDKDADFYRQVRVIYTCIMYMYTHKLIYFIFLS